MEYDRLQTFPELHATFTSEKSVPELTEKKSIGTPLLELEPQLTNPYL
jgi:hypothetical protein